MRSVNTPVANDRKPAELFVWTTPQLRLIPLTASESGPSGISDAISNFS